MAVDLSWELIKPSPLVRAVDGSEGPALVARDLAIDPNTRELLIENGDLVLTRGLDSIRQDVDMRLNFLLGEWFLDESVGVPYLTRVLGKAGVNLDAARTVFSDELLAVQGVRAIRSLTLTLTKATRALRVSWSVETDLGALNGQTAVTTV